MDELLAHAMQGVDPDAPGAIWKLYANLWAMIPWASLFWWNLLFVVIGGLLGWWHRRFWEGVAWAWVLGPIGWVVLLWRARRKLPPPLRR